MTLTYESVSAVRPMRAARASAPDLIWADKVGIFVSVGGLAFLAYLWGLAVIAAGLSGGNHLLQHEIGLGLQCDFAAASSIWLFLRVVDLAAGGPWRRARRKGGDQASSQ